MNEAILASLARKSSPRIVRSRNGNYWVRIGSKRLGPWDNRRDAVIAKRSAGR